MTVFNWLKTVHGVCLFSSTERPNTVASNSEIRRWFLNGAVELNGSQIRNPDEPLMSLTKVVLFPKSALRRSTLWEETC